MTTPVYYCPEYVLSRHSFEGCSPGGQRGITEDILAQRERMVFQWAATRQLPIAFVMAGGYTGNRLSQDQLVDLHRLTIQAATEHQ
jgi:acetoin utilization deacetylase AcuC-like enzyme